MSKVRFTFKGKAAWTCIHDDAAGYLWYIKLDERANPPYRRQVVVEAIVDVAADGSVAGIEIVDSKMRGPPLVESPKWLAEKARAAAEGQLAEARAALERLRAGLQEISDFIPPAVAEGDPYHEIAIHIKRKARALLSG